MQLLHSVSKVILFDNIYMICMSNCFMVLSVPFLVLPSTVGTFIVNCIDQCFFLFVFLQLHVLSGNRYNGQIVYLLTSSFL